MVTLDIYSYKKSYSLSDVCSNMMHKAPVRGNSHYCSNYAFMNNSPFYMLTDICQNVQTICGGYDASCYISASTGTDISINKINNWLGSLESDICDPFSTCAVDICGNKYGITGGYSLYEKNNLSTPNYIVQNPKYDYEQEFNSYYNEISGNLNKLDNTYTKYRTEWYKYIDICDNRIDLNIPHQDEYLKKEYENTIYAYENVQYDIDRNFYNLFDIQYNLETKLFKLGEEIQYNSDYLKLLNKKLQIGKDFFNNLMGKDSGAIGMLKDNKYNSSVVLIENITLILTITTVLFIYFKYINKS